MAKVDVLDIMRTKMTTPLEFEFDNLWIPPINTYLSQQDIDALRKIATSIRLSAKIQQKYKMIDDIMRPRGFKRFSAGTNRVVYSFLEDTRFVVKIAVDKVGMQDNPMEFKNQFLLKPYVTKMFYISPCGTVGFCERVLPIKNKEEFKEIAPDVFDILVNKILGKYVIEDIGTKYFMNYGVRIGYGPVLLDYPYVYELDGQKLYCSNTIPETGATCNGEIDYDVGFNYLACTKCGKRYMANELRDNSNDNTIIIKGGNKMRVVIKCGDEVIRESIPSDDYMRREETTETKEKKSDVMKAIIIDKDGTKIDNSKYANTTPNKQSDGKPKLARDAYGRFVSSSMKTYICTGMKAYICTPDGELINPYSKKNTSNRNRDKAKNKNEEIAVDKSSSEIETKIGEPTVEYDEKEPIESPVEDEVEAISMVNDESDAEEDRDLDEVYDEIQEAKEALEEDEDDMPFGNSEPEVESSYDDYDDRHSRNYSRGSSISTKSNKKNKKKNNKHIRTSSSFIDDDEY